MPKTIDEISKDVKPCNFAEFVSSIKMTPEQQKLLIGKTKDQSMSNIWFEQRKDRITASILKSAAIKVANNNKLINRDKSRTILSKICGYYPRWKSKQQIGALAMNQVLEIDMLKQWRENIETSKLRRLASMFMLNIPT